MVMIEKAVPGVSEQALSRFAQRARKAAGVRGKVNVLLTSSREVRTLNRCFRGKDKPTDVLSFPAIAEVARQLAGDIVISGDIAAANARRFRHAPADEIKILILHGMLHLAGHDHESDDGRMARKEEHLRRELRLTDSLIRRVQGSSRAQKTSMLRRRRAR